MTKHVRLPAYDATDLDRLSYTNGELVNDTTNKTVRYMDGVTPGGYKLASQTYVQTNAITSSNLATNLATAFDQLSKCNNYQPWLTQWTKLLQYPSVTDFLQNNTVSPTRSDVDSIIQVAETKL